MAADEKGMQKWRIVGGFNVIVGCIVLVVQVATLLTLWEWVDWIGIGIWGGCFMISAGSLTIQRSPRLISMSVCALLSGLALVIFYAWNLGVYNNYSYNYTRVNATGVYKPYCIHYGYTTSLCQWRLASDIIFIVCGSLAMMINIVLSANTKAIVVIRPLVRYPVNTVNAYPMSTTNTTYVMTNSRPSAYPVATQQMVYQMPNNGTYPTGGVVYQTSPGHQQPVYYAQANPPAYTATATAAPVYYSV
ncbi:uncharacterized protein LOC130698096 [Daphnia carinata]|uniref:uncharacterized protein LOC130698096 n=1 Tax=Daphnia carinata TaxID=120202 RepID=UPI00257DD3AA|nr:uncharacterized protein LOC130698096 [Daphnia carinata]